MHFSIQTFIRSSAVVLIISFFSTIAYSQTITFASKSVSLQEVFKSIEDQTSIRFVLSEEDIDQNAEVKLAKDKYELDELLNEVKGQIGVILKKIDDYYVVTMPEQGKGGQEIIYQTVRGVVSDLESESTLPGANVYRVGHLQNSTSTNMDGQFVIKVPLGRVELAFSFIGYKTVILPLLVTSGEEQNLVIQLEASVSKLKEVTIEADRDKARTQNELAYASGRGFNVLEANKYAGTLGDPARMVRSYAGVIPARDDRNDIVIRGNSPTGLQWKLDDIEIPNPNHYGGIGLTGNTTTILNMNLLSNSDFLMGAFPSEYGNALSGVFDLHTKKINPSKRQFRFQSGWNGFELGAEGPFSKKKDIGTYSLTYRYSFLDVMKSFGVDFGVLPQFQDLTGKFDFKLGEKTNLSLLGIWGTSFIDLDDRELETAEELPQTGQHIKTGSDLALAGINLKHRFNKKLVLKSNVSVIDNLINTKVDTFNFNSGNTNRVFTDNSGETKYSFFSQLDYRNNRNLLRVGFRWDTYVVKYNGEQINSTGQTETIYKENGNLNMARYYLENEYRLSDRFRARGGIHMQYLPLNGSFAVEPRLALRYLVSDFNVFAFAYGNHHMLQPRTIYFVETQTATGSVHTNEDLDFSGAHHFNFSYNLSINENLRLKAETYYQHLYDIPVKTDPTSTFSMVNVGAAFYIPQEDSLVNEGIGRNYGVEVTLERFLNKGYYFMLNGALFKSEYQTLEKKWRSTAFDMEYTVNGLAGYEKWLSQKFAIGADLKVTFAGGKPYVPVNESASVASGEVVYKEADAYSPRYPGYFRTDLKVYYRTNFKKAYVEFAVDFQNITNQKNIYRQEFDPKTGEYKTNYHMTFFPMATFKVLF
ncbi:MAG: hypothetical protein CL840_00255 [Crocinitomicaceae bacterium]|nr:hypothetical protein [Crocinitomicaceae bacterium]|tara:strand:- start:13728 stop:16340 length:2613 start_codon:yes stop_codon:yes gene_type:complete